MPSLATESKITSGPREGIMVLTDGKAWFAAYRVDGGESLATLLKKQTGIDFVDFRSAEVGRSVAEVFGVLSWIGLFVKVLLLVVAAAGLFFFIVILPAYRPFGSSADTLYALGSLVWLVVGLPFVTATLVACLGVRRVVTAASSLITVATRILKQCSPALYAGASVTLAHLVGGVVFVVLVPMGRAAIESKLSLGPLRLPGAGSFAARLSGFLGWRLFDATISARATIQPTSGSKTQPTQITIVDSKAPLQSQIIGTQVQWLLAHTDEIERRVRGGIVQPSIAIAVGVIALVALPPLLLSLF